MANNTTALIVGCGIAGPVLALLLKKKGYRPIVFEKVRELGDAGASLMLMPNGMKVFGLVDLADQIAASTWPLEQYRDLNVKGDLLGGSDLPGEFVRKYTQPGAGVKRTSLNLMLRDVLLANGIECREGWALEGITENTDGITAHFGGDRSVSGAFLVGCDGIKSKSREIILKQHKIAEDIPTYTSLSQTAGISATPLALQEVSAMRNWYGNEIHTIAYPISRTHTSWAITQREVEQGKETWRLYTKEEMASIAAKLEPKLADFDPAVLELVNTAERLTKYGLFDRSQLEPEQWYWSRCVLVGDAAHPTSPHLGQGANQALEDCYHLSNALPDIANGSGALDKETLDKIFSEYARKRQPRTSKLVKGARAQGELRVLKGSAEDLQKRDETLAAGWRDQEAVAMKYDLLCKEPF